MHKLHVHAVVLAAALGAVCGRALATPAYQVTFNVSTELQNVFVYADEFNGEVYAWDLLPAALGTVSAGTTTFQLGNHDLMAWAILATHSPSGVATGINDSLPALPDGVPFETVFPGYAESTVESNIANLYVNGAYNDPEAFFLTEFVLAREDTLKTDFPVGSLHMYTFSDGVNVGSATFSIVPEPAALPVVLLCLAALPAARRRR